jgi:hypothetical protein
MHIRLEPRLAYLLVYTVTTTVHGAILSGHDDLDRGFVLDIPRERRDFGNDNYNLMT